MYVFVNFCKSVFGEKREKLLNFATGEVQNNVNANMIDFIKRFPLPFWLKAHVILQVRTGCYNAASNNAFPGVFCLDSSVSPSIL